MSPPACPSLQYNCLYLGFNSSPIKMRMPSYNPVLIDLIMNDEDLKKRAEKIAADKVGFQVHFGIYIAVNLFLAAIWYFTTTPHGSVFPWFVFVLFGWGIGIIGHFLAVYRGEAYLDEKVEKEYQRLKRKIQH